MTDRPQNKKIWLEGNTTILLLPNAILHYVNLFRFSSIFSSQVVEISAITEHLLTECENKDKFAKCPRCLEAREKTEIDQHISDKTCPSKYKPDW